MKANMAEQHEGQERPTGHGAVALTAVVRPWDTILRGVGICQRAYHQEVLGPDFFLKKSSNQCEEGKPGSWWQKWGGGKRIGLPWSSFWGTRSFSPLCREATFLSLPVPL